MKAKLKLIYPIKTQIANNTFYFFLPPKACQNGHTILLSTQTKKNYILRTKSTGLLAGIKVFPRREKYPEALIDFGISKVIAVDKARLRIVKANSEECVIPFVFNPKDPEVFPGIINNLPILEKVYKMNDIISKYKFIKSTRQSYNRKRLLGFKL